MIVRCLVSVMVFFILSCQKPADVITSVPILKINDKQVKAQDFAQALARRLRAYDALTVKDPLVLKRAKEDTLQTFIINALVEQYARETNIKVLPQDLEAEITRRKKNFPDEFAFRRNLADENLSIEDWQRQVEASLLLSKITDFITQSVRAPNEEEMKSFYNSNMHEFSKPARVKLRQIVLQKEEDAKKVYEALANRGKMAELAKKYSVAPEGANGGETDWIDKGILDVFDQAFKMPVGTRSKILRSPYGWHIYDVLKKEPETQLSFKVARLKIEPRLIEERKKAAFSAWLEEQVRRSKVYRNEGLLNAMAVSTKGSTVN